MTLVRNSAKCTACDTEIESKGRHDFHVHFCDKEPTPARKWVKIGNENVLVDDPGVTTFRFGVDGGLAYIRRIGSGYTDTSLYLEYV